MNQWLIIHSLESYEQHKDMIGCKVDKNSRKKRPIKKSFTDISKGDHIIYYGRGKLLLGIFRVISEMELIENDVYWGEMYVYKIEPISLPKKPLDFSNLLCTSLKDFDLFKKSLSWASTLQGRIAIPLTANDYQLFENFFSQ